MSTGHRGRLAAVAAVLALAAAGVGTAALATHSGGRNHAAAAPSHTAKAMTAAKTKRAHSSEPVVARQTELAALVTTHEAFPKPAATAPRLGRIQARGYYTRERTVLPVLGHRVGKGGGGGFT